MAAITFVQTKLEVLTTPVFQEEPNDRRGWLRDMKWYEVARHARSWDELRFAIPREHPCFEMVWNYGKRILPPTPTVKTDDLTSVEE